MHTCINLDPYVPGYDIAKPKKFIGAIMAEKVEIYKKLEGFLLKDVQKTGKRLGSGTFGNVEELMVGGTVCVGKRFHMALLEVDKGGVPVASVIGRFAFGCELLSKLQHPNIVQFMGLCLFDDVPYPLLVTEAVYDDFHTILVKHSNLPFPLILYILHDVVKGLDYLHSWKSPVIHQSLTARNVLIDKASVTSKLADVGSSLLIDSKKLLLVGHTRGILPYMPPEALNVNFADSGKYDMFSFGHLTLFAILQEFPGELLPSTYNDPLTEEPKMRNEVERRELYIRRVFLKLTRSHAMTEIVVQCLHNNPEERPTANDALKIIGHLLTEESENPYLKFDMTELLSVAEESPHLTSTYVDRTTAPKPGGAQLQNEVPGLLEIHRTYTVYGVLKRFGWRQHIFQIKKGYLRFFNGTKMEKVVDELDLSSVVHIATRVPDDDDKTKFYFEVHFSKGKGSPWVLRAYTQEDQIKWIEAIKPGSASCVRTSHYETVSLRIDDGAYSYVSAARSPVMKSSASNDNLYDEPRSYSHQPMQFLNESHNRAIPAAKSVESSSDAITQLYNGNKLSDTSFSSCNTNVVESSNTDHILPNKTESLKERPSSHLDSETEEELEKNNQYQFQLRILEQMQKLVQKLEDASDVAGSPKLSKGLFSSWTKPDDPSLTANTASLQHYTSEEVSKSSQVLISHDKTEKQSTAVISQISSSTNVDPSASISSAAEQQGPCNAPKKQDSDTASQKHIHGLESSSVPHTSLHHFTSESEKSHVSLSKNIYVNLDNGGSNESSNTLLSTCENEKEDRSENQVITDDTDEGPQQRSKTKLMVKGEYKSPVSHNKQQFLKLLQREKESDISESDMIRKIRATSSTISCGVLSHLSSYDDKTDQRKIVHPEWTRANTKVRKVELSLDELQKEAIFIPDSALTSLTEIGEGQYGTVYKGLYKPRRSTEIEVAIKTIKVCDSDKENENFIKEMSVMSTLLHPNIVRFFGLTKQGERVFHYNAQMIETRQTIDKPRIVLEYLPHGDLKSFLKKNERPVEVLVKYMLDIATGMHYISEKGLVHRDLAARNVIVSKDEICKVGDFGLLRELPKDEKIYVASNKVALPVRWMAPESLPPTRQFSTASDIWSFGILMWEMHNPNKIPYEDMDNMECAIRVVKEGLRVPIPECFPSTVKRIMKACLITDPTKRPSFLLIASLLTNIYYGTE